MEVIRIGAIAPPATKRSQWARERLAEALEQALQPVAVPLQEVVSFTSTMNPSLASQLKVLAQEKGIPLARLTAGLLEALRVQSVTAEVTAAPTEMAFAIPGQANVRDVLHPLLEQSAAGIEKGKIVFAEAATGTGKGKMIAALAANAAAKGDTVVISAPLAVTWQLIDALKGIREAQVAGITMSLGRPNFVSPVRLLEWAVENERDELARWVKHGGRPLSARTVGASSVIDHELCWMLEDALVLAEDLPVDTIMLSPDDEEDCPAQVLYKAMRSNHTEAGIILCSHYMLATHVRFLQLRGLAGEDGADDLAQSLSLPQTIDTLIVDEAHLLEQAFAAIYSHNLRLRPLIRAIEHQVNRGKTPAISALNALGHQITRTVQQAENGRSLVYQLDEVPGLEPVLRDALNALGGISLKSLDGTTKAVIRVAIRAMKDALSGHSRLRLELTPVRQYPTLVSGRANLQKALLCLWDSVAGAVLVSATIYASDDQATLTRWKLEVPPERALYLSPVHPAWTTEPVVLHDARNTIEPNDSPEWADETAGLIRKVAEQAVGGTLVLCTSYQNAELLQARLSPDLGTRLIVQTKASSASMCVAQYKGLYQEGKRPVWLGLGAAWTGIDLSDEHAPNPADDAMLSDLVITRLPVGLNRSLTHERRVAIAGFKIVTLEAVWQFRQGLGRLVRGPGVRNKRLWVLDSRVGSGAAWVAPYKRLLSRYRTSST
ncbi:ATP-dependent DNA helicase DinG [Pseudomonas aeruginosa]|nr:helicase C-terminal domain-containing protein [Pseudomonas aeruginosa]CRN66652.1 ATP-dependent DNA helicase DinG [Pseudomonas aeruginosa]